MSSGSAPHSTICRLLSSFLKANVRRAPAAARCTFRSQLFRSRTRGAMPPSARTCRTQVGLHAIVGTPCYVRTPGSPCFCTSCADLSKVAPRQVLQAVPAGHGAHSCNQLHASTQQQTLSQLLVSHRKLQHTPPAQHRLQGSSMCLTLMCRKPLTIFLISMFSCARLVIASAARLATPPLPLRACAAGAHSPVLDVARDGGLLMLCAARSFTRPAARHQQHDTGSLTRSPRLPLLSALSHQHQRGKHNRRETPLAAVGNSCWLFHPPAASMAAWHQHPAQQFALTHQHQRTQRHY